MTIESLNKKMDKKWKQLQAKKLTYGLTWLNAMHDLLDWYEEERVKIFACPKCDSHD